MNKQTAWIVLIFCIYCPAVSHAHPGPVNSDGGHYDIVTRKYHYHKKPKTKKPAVSERIADTPIHNNPSTSDSPTSTRNSAIVTRVIDGNSVLVEINGNMDRVRFQKINPPKLNTPAGKACKQFLQTLVGGKAMIIHHNNIRDKEGYLLSEGFWNGLSIKKAMEDFMTSNQYSTPPP